MFFILSGIQTAISCRYALFVLHAVFLLLTKSDNSGFFLNLTNTFLYIRPFTTHCTILLSMYALKFCIFIGYDFFFQITKMYLMR